MKIKRKSTAQFNALVIITGLFLILLPASVHASWWNPSWGYRNTVDLTGSASDLTDYQVKVTVNFIGGKMKSDFSDIRFISSDDVTLLSHWRKSYTPSSTAELWVKVPSIPSSGTMIYMYYDNPSANSASNGEATFDFFDKFEPSSSKWTVSGYAHSTTGTGYVRAYKTAPGSVSSDLVSNVFGSGDFKAYLKIKSEGYKQHSSCSYKHELKLVSDSGESGLDSSAYSDFTDKSYTISGDNLRLKLYAYAKGCESTVTKSSGSGDGTCSGNSCSAGVIAPGCPAGYGEINYYCKQISYYDPCCHGGCGAGHGCWGTTCREYRVCKNPSLSAEAKLWIDDLYVRKYASPEPVASFGTEELGCTIDGGSCSADDECCSGHCKPDYVGTEKFCADADQCVHDGNVYNNGQNAPDCCTGDNKRYCNAGTWACASCGTDTCTGACGTGVNSCKWRDFYCSLGNCGSTDYDCDGAQSRCGACKGIGYWNLGGEVSANSCCGDDSGEYKRTRQCTSGCISDNSDDACCDASNKCVYTSVCYADNACLGALKCSSSSWIEHCTNGVQDCDETGVDCGGADCCSCDAQACSLDGDCCSGHCAADYNGTGKWCEPPTSCAHEGVEYLNGVIAPDCFTDGCSEWHCNSGTWSTADCGSYTCFAGSCTLACSQACGATCDEDSDCTLSNACGDIPGG